MNHLGHSYVAYKIIGHMNSYVAAGAILPDLIPFVHSTKYFGDQAFTDIHEAGEKVLEINRDMGLAMITHGVTYGVDQFNKDIDVWLLGSDDKIKNALAERLVNWSGISFDVAYKNRLHNYLWVGVDLYILYQRPRFVQQLVQAHKHIKAAEITHLLANATGLDQHELSSMITTLLDVHNPDLLHSLDGITQIWKIFLAALPDRDTIDTEKTRVLFQDIYEMFLPQWPHILKRVISDVRKNITRYL